MNTTKTFLLRKDILKWLSNYKPTHLLTIQLPLYLRTYDYEKSKKILKRLMISFERKLIGRHWNRNHLKFIAFAEQNKDFCWHYHILLCDNDYSDYILNATMNKVILKENLDIYTFNLQRIIETHNKVYSYCIKNLNINDMGRFDVDRLIVSSELFDLEFKMRKTRK